MNLNDEELTALLDRSIGPGPDGPHLDLLIHEGQRKVRRRRGAVAAVVAATVVIAGAGAVATLDRGGDTTVNVGPATEPTATPSDPGPTVAPDNPLGEDAGHSIIELRADGTLDLVPGVEILKRIDNPLDQPLPNRSVAVEFSYQGRERWAILQVLVDGDGQITGGGAAAAYVDRAEMARTLMEYVEANDNKVFHP